jgi:hypothetical protein
VRIRTVTRRASLGVLLLSCALLGGTLAGCATPGLDPTTAPAATVRVTPTPAPTAVPLAISKVSVTESVAPRDKATVVITTAAGAECTITVTYDSGPSQASGLDPKTADASGKVTWSWTIGSNTIAGTWPIDIACFKGERDGTLQLTFRVR